MVLFPIIGLLIWVAFLIAVMAVCGIIWAVGKTLWWFLDLPGRLDRRNATAIPPPPKAPAPSVRLDPKDSSGIWPKWTPSHRLYKDYEHALWQEQFDALNSRE